MNRRNRLFNKRFKIVKGSLCSSRKLLFICSPIPLRSRMLLFVFFNHFIKASYSKSHFFASFGHKIEGISKGLYSYLYIARRMARKIELKNTKRSILLLNETGEPTNSNLLEEQKPPFMILNHLLKKQFLQSR